MATEERTRAAALLLLVLRATIFRYHQGEEHGLPASDVPDESIVDMNGRDGVRIPVPWQAPLAAGPDAGFTSGSPWLPVGGTAEVLNVARQAEDQTSMLNLYRDLIRIRRTSTALRNGTYRTLHCGDDTYAFERASLQERIAVVVNSTHLPSFCPKR